MHKSIPAGLLVAVVMVSGCSRPATVVGTWAGTQTSPQGVTLQNTVTFTADGRLMITFRATGGRYGPQTVSTDGTYTAAGGTLTEAISSMSEPGRTRTIPHPVTSTYQYTLAGDTLTITGLSRLGPLVLTRQSPA